MLSNSNTHFHCEFRCVLWWMTSSLNRDETYFFRLFRVGCSFASLQGGTNCSLLAPLTKYGIRASCILCWLVLVSATVIYTHAEAFLRQAQNYLIFFYQLLIRIHYPTGFALTITRSSVWLQASLKPVQCSLLDAQLRSTTKSFAQWNLILVHLQHSETLEKQENKGKLFEINV